MPEYVTLIGAEEVRSAASQMQSAADNMQRAASAIDNAVERLILNMEGFVSRIEAATVQQVVTQTCVGQEPRKLCPHSSIVFDTTKRRNVCSLCGEEGEQQ